MRRVDILLSIIAAVIFFSCTAKDTAKQVATKSVKIEYAEPYLEGVTTDFMGKVVAREEINFAFRVSGTLQNIPIKIGQLVRKGDLVATLDSRDYRTQLSATEAEYRQIKAEAERIIELYKRKSLAKNDYDKAVSALEQITAKLTAHSDALKDCRLLAPIDGRIQRISYSSGETVGAGTPVVSMLSSDNFEVEIFVPSSLYSKMTGSYSCRIPIVSDKNYILKFVSMSPKANANGLYAVRFKIEGGEDEGMAAGMSCSVAISESLGDENLVAIPLSSIFEHDGESHVWIYNDKTNQVVRSKIELVKLSSSGEMVIKDGVKSGEQVVVAGVHSIDEKMKLRKIAKNSSTNVGGLK